MGRGAEAETDVVNFIKQYYETLGFGPSRREVADACQLPLGVVQSIIVRLASEDRIWYTENVARSIRPKIQEIT